MAFRIFNAIVVGFVLLTAALGVFAGAITGHGFAQEMGWGDWAEAMLSFLLPACLIGMYWLVWTMDQR